MLKAPSKQRSDDHQRSQLRIDEGVSNATGQAQAVRETGISRLGACYQPSLGLNSLAIQVDSTRFGHKRSPSWRPASTSTSAPEVFPKVM